MDEAKGVWEERQANGKRGDEGSGLESGSCVVPSPLGHRRHPSCGCNQIASYLFPPHPPEPGGDTSSLFKGREKKTGKKREKLSRPGEGRNGGR